MLTTRDTNPLCVSTANTFIALPTSPNYYPCGNWIEAAVAWSDGKAEIASPMSVEAPPIERGDCLCLIPLFPLVSFILYKTC